MELLQFVLQIAEWLLVFIVTALAGARAADPSNYDELSRAILVFLQAGSFKYTFACALGVFCLKIVNEGLLRRRITKMGQVRFVLNSLHRKYFSNVPEEELYLHRVTVLRAKRFFSTTPHRLCVFARSGTSFQKSKTYLRIDDEHEDENEGVAGRAWFTNATATVTDLPQWPDKLYSPTQDTLTRSQYAQTGLLSVEKASRLNVKSRSITATVVRTVSGRKWGVLVLDSRNPQGIQNSREKKEIVELSAAIMSHMV